MHGSETWPMKVEHELKMNRTEMSMIRWMCGVKLNERKKNEEPFYTVGGFVRSASGFGSRTDPVPRLHS